MDLPQETLPIVDYDGDNNFVNDIRQKLLRFRKLSEKQIEAALNQMRREGIKFEDENENWLSRKIKEIREHKLIQILKYKTKK